MDYCSECGSTVAERDRFCPECGEPVDQTDDAGFDDDDSYNWSSTEIESERYAADAGPSYGTPDAHGGSGGALSFAFSFPTEGGYGPILKGGVLLFFSFLLVPFFTVFGYAYRLCRAAAYGESRRPPFDDWGALTKDGFVFFLVYLSFVVGLGVAFAITSAVSDLLGLVVYLFGLYFAPAVLTTYAATGSVEETYTTSRVADFALSGAYLKAVLVYFALSLIVSILAGISVLTVVGPLFVYAFSIMAIASYWGYVYNRATREGVVPAVRDRPPRNHHAD